jgi:hypothetical protein
MPSHDLSWRLYRPTDELAALHDASAILLRRPRLLAQSAGIFSGLTTSGHSLFPGLCWLVLSDRCGPVALLPLRASVELDGPFPLRCLRTINRFDMLYGDAQLRSGIDANMLMNSVLGAKLFDGKPCDVFRIHDARGGSGYAELAAAAAPGSRWTAAGASVLATSMAFPEWQRAQSKNLRSQIRKSAQRLAERGEVHSRVITAPDEVDAALARFVAMEAAGYKQSLNPLAREPDELAILQRAFAVHAPSGEAFIHELTIDGRAVASQVGFLLGARAHLLRVAYDEAFTEASPGTVLLARLIEWCCGHEGIDSIDCIVRQGWHDRWHPEVETSAHATIPNIRTLAGCVVGLLRWGRRLLRPPVTPHSPSLHSSVA